MTQSNDDLKLREEAARILGCELNGDGVVYWSHPIHGHDIDYLPTAEELMPEALEALDNACLEDGGARVDLVSRPQGSDFRWSCTCYLRYENVRRDADHAAIAVLETLIATHKTE